MTEGGPALATIPEQVNTKSCSEYVYHKNPMQPKGLLKPLNLLEHTRHGSHLVAIKMHCKKQL